jgi:hypothetical protein
LLLLLLLLLRVCAFHSFQCLVLFSHGLSCVSSSGSAHGSLDYYLNPRTKITIPASVEGVDRVDVELTILLLNILEVSIGAKVDLDALGLGCDAAATYGAAATRSRLFLAGVGVALVAKLRALTRQYCITRSLLSCNRRRMRALLLVCLFLCAILSLSTSGCRCASVQARPFARKHALTTWAHTYLYARRPDTRNKCNARAESRPPPLPLALFSASWGKLTPLSHLRHDSPTSEFHNHYAMLFGGLLIALGLAERVLLRMLRVLRVACCCALLFFCLQFFFPPSCVSSSAALCMMFSFTPSARRLFCAWTWSPPGHRRPLRSLPKRFAAS